MDKKIMDGLEMVFLCCTDGIQAYLQVTITQKSRFGIGRPWSSVSGGGKSVSGIVAVG